MHVVVKLNMTNSQILAIVQSITIDKINFDSLSREDSNDVLYIMNQAYRTILLEVDNLRDRLSRVDGTADYVRSGIQSGEYDLTINLNTFRFNHPANFGNYIVKLRE